MQTSDGGLRVDCVHQDGHVVLAIYGEIDLASAPSLSAAIATNLQRVGKVIVDFAGVTFMDSSGLNVLVSTAKAGNPDRVVVRNPPPSVRRLLSITGVDTVIQVEDDSDGTRSAS